MKSAFKTGVYPKSCYAGLVRERTVSNGFTLIEMLVVVATIGVLASLLLPALSRAKESAHQSGCSSNLRQLILSTSIYVMDSGDRFPCQSIDGSSVRVNGGDGVNFYDLLAPYVTMPQIWLCPSSKKGIYGDLMTYHMNGLIVTTNGLKSALVRVPTLTLLIAESGGNARFDQAYLRPDHDGNYLYDRPQMSHMGGSNAGFVDGHVLWFSDYKWNSNSFSVTP